MPGVLLIQVVFQSLSLFVELNLPLLQLLGVALDHALGDVKGVLAMVEVPPHLIIVKTCRESDLLGRLEHRLGLFLSLDFSIDTHGFNKDGRVILIIMLGFGFRFCDFSRFMIVLRARISARSRCGFRRLAISCNMLEKVFLRSHKVSYSLVDFGICRSLLG